MKWFDYLRRHRGDGAIPYVLGGAAGVIAFAIVATFGLAVLDRFTLGTSDLAAVVSAVLVDLTNADRSSNSLGDLTLNPILTEAAQAKADDMAAKGYFAHVSPEGKDPWYWFTQAGYSFVYAGENLAMDFSDSVNVEQAWMNSPGHRANILNGHYTEIGIAIAQGSYQGRPTTFVVQMFGSPAKVAAAPLPIQAATLPQNPTELATATAATATVAATSVPEVASVATTTPVLGASASEAASVAPWWAYPVASPGTTLRYAYYAFAALVLLLLFFVTRLELHKRHMRHFVAACLLFVLMAGLFAFASFAFFATPALANTQSAGILSAFQ